MDAKDTTLVGCYEAIADFSVEGKRVSEGDIVAISLQNNGTHCRFSRIYSVRFPTPVIAEIIPAHKVKRMLGQTGTRAQLQKVPCQPDEESSA